MEIPRHWSASTLGTLRNCTLSKIGSLDGVRFVRCLPIVPGIHRLQATTEQKLEVILRACREINDPGVVLANNPDHGGDYLRVDCDSFAHRVICHLKS